MLVLTLQDLTRLDLTLQDLTRLDLTLQDLTRLDLMLQDLALSAHHRFGNILDHFALFGLELEGCLYGLGQFRQ